MTSVRWKPQTTYRSPTASTSTFHLEGRVIGSDTSSSSQSPSPHSLPLQLSPSRAIQSSQAKSHKRWMTGPSLPLYHPLGRLALSLPDLDPTAFGLPAPAVIIDDPARRSSHRARRPAAKVRDANETVPSPVPVPFIDAVRDPSPEHKDKPAPRRRRPAGGGNKRRRREVDDGDASYPAKRTRVPRGSAAIAMVSTPTGSTPDSLDNSPPQAGDQDGPMRPERRAIKSRATRARRDSTASEGTVTSVSASVVAANAASHKGAGGDAVDTSVLSTRPQDAEMADPDGTFDIKETTRSLD